MSETFKDNSNKVYDCSCTGSCIRYGEGEKIREGEFCYLLLKDDEEFLGVVKELIVFNPTEEFKQDDLYDPETPGVILSLLGIDGRHYSILLYEVAQHLTIEDISTQDIEEVHDSHCNCSECKEIFEVFGEDDIENEDDAIESDIYEQISQLTGLLADMTQDDAARELYIMKKSVF